MVINIDLQNKSDAELIALFTGQNKERAFDVLLRRHYNGIHQRFNKYVRDDEIASDLSQQLWMRVLSNLSNYSNQDKFQHYLNKIATNLVRDHWRSKSSNRESFYESEEEAVAAAFDKVSLDAGVRTDELVADREMITKLVHELIPSLPCDQRLIYLLKHEAEHWDKDQPLQWQHLADLCNVSADGVCLIFESARDKLFKNSTGSGNAESLECLETTIFLLWTLSQRQDKSKRYTETFFAELLNIPVNTFKSRYRASIQALSRGLQ